MGQAKYKKIADDLREKINSQTYEMNKTIPSESQLQERYGVSRQTIREAISILVNEGYLRKEKGSGTYVENTFKRSVEDFKKNKTIGVITTYVSDYIFPDIIRGIEKKLRENGYSLLLSCTNNSYQNEKECLKKMLQHNVQGLIVEPTKSNQYNPNLAFYTQLNEQDIPVVMINATYEGLNMPKVTVNDELGGFLATEYMMKKNHRNLLLVTKIDDLQGKYRMNGFIKAFEDNKRSFKSENILTYTTETQDRILEPVLMGIEKQKFTGIVAYNDELASRIVTMLTDKNIFVPTDISIIGNDNSLLSKIGKIPLTTLNHPKERLGRDAGELILRALQKGSKAKDISYDPQIIERNSIKKLK